MYVGSVNTLCQRLATYTCRKYMKTSLIPRTNWAINDLEINWHQELETSTKQIPRRANSSLNSVKKETLAHPQSSLALGSALRCSSMYLIDVSNCGCSQNGQGCQSLPWWFMILLSLWQPVVYFFPKHGQVSNNSRLGWISMPNDYEAVHNNC